VKAKIELKSSITIGSITEFSPKGFTLGIKPEFFNYFNLPLYGLELAPGQQKKKKDTYQLGRLIFNLWGQCCYNKILLF